MRNSADASLNQRRQQRLADPAKREAGDGDSELHAVYDLIQVLMEFQHRSRTDAVRFDELLDSRLATLTSANSAAAKKAFAATRRTIKNTRSSTNAIMDCGNSNITKELALRLGFSTRSRLLPPASPRQCRRNIPLQSRKRRALRPIFAFFFLPFRSNAK